MTAEQRKVLDMLAVGKIKPEEAEQLLNHLDLPESENAVEDEAAEATETSNGDKRPTALRYLRVVVDKPNRDNVNIRLPLKLVRTGLKLSALMPSKAGTRLSDKNLDLSYLGKLKGDALNAALAELDIDIETDKGEKVHVFCE